MTMTVYVVKVTYCIYHICPSISNVSNGSHGSTQRRLAGDAPNKAVREEADLAVKAVFSHWDKHFLFSSQVMANRWKTTVD